MAADQWISTQQSTKIGVRNGEEYGEEVQWVKAEEEELEVKAEEEELEVKAETMMMGRLIL